MTEETDRDFVADIEQAKGNPKLLREIAQDIQSCGGPRNLTFEAIRLAREADKVLHPLGRIGNELGLPWPKALPLYRYKIDAATFHKIEAKLKTDLHSDLKRSSAAPIFVLWAAYWYRSSYQGGTQRWIDMERVLGISLIQDIWRDLADDGFEFWNIEPLVTPRGNQRLANIARQGGFPAAAIASGASWPRRFLERAVGEVLGAVNVDIKAAIEICERNEYLMPSSWRGEEMQAICGELALKIAELRHFADREHVADGRPYSAILDEILVDWRDQLPITLDGAANTLIDSLLESRKLSGGGSIRVERLVKQCADGWREQLAFHLDGRWEDKSRIMDTSTRVFIHSAGKLTDKTIGRLAFLEHEAEQFWTVRPMGSGRNVEFPFEEAALADFYARGERLAQAIVLPGGRAVSSGLRVFESRNAQAHSDAHFTLVGQGSGGYRIDEVLLDFPVGWTINAQDENSKVEQLAFVFAPQRQLFRCTGQIVVCESNGDSYLIRTGQSADRKDQLMIIGRDVSGLQVPTNAKLIHHPLRAEIEDGLTRRTGAQMEVCWRRKGDRAWLQDIIAAGPGECEFGWLDEQTGHLRAKDTAWILPADFSLVQHQHRSSTEVVLNGWQGKATLGNEKANDIMSWRLRTDPPQRALVPLHLDPGSSPAFTLNVPLHAKEWITTNVGDLIREDTVMGLADLRNAVARAPGRSALMGDVQGFSGPSTEATWTVKSQLDLADLRNDISALIRPLGIDAVLKLNFLNGSEDYWYVTEFGNELQSEPGGGLRPKNAIIGEMTQICGRYLGAPEKEVEFGAYEGAGSLSGARPISLPKLRGPWLVYLREGSRILTRPRYIAGEEPRDPPQHALGRGMAEPIQMAQLNLNALVESICQDPLSQDASKALNAILELAVSLNGLPPQTFEIFRKLEVGSLIAPLLLYRCEEKHLTAVLEIFDGLPSSWTLLSLGAWDAAFQSHGQYLVSRLGDPEWALSRITERQNEIAARAPQLSPLVCRDYRPLAWDDIRLDFTNHTCEGINSDADVQSPFRDDFSALLPKENFAAPLLRVFDAPLVAGLAAKEKVTLSLIQKLTIKDVERRHPNYFANAYGYAVSELKNA